MEYYFTGNRNGASSDTSRIVLFGQDSDTDGVYDLYDNCPNTSLISGIDSNGCSSSQKDSDNDGLVDSLDQCPGTETATEVDEFGCSWHQYDWDNDGTENSEDPCLQLMTNYCGTDGEYLIQSHISELNHIYNFDISNDGSLVALHTHSGLFMFDYEGNAVHDFSVSIPANSKIMFSKITLSF